MPLDKGQINHPGEVLNVVADGGEGELATRYLLGMVYATQGRFCSSSCPLRPSIPAAASTKMQKVFCFLSMAPSLSPAAKRMAIRLASSDFERERS